MVDKLLELVAPHPCSGCGRIGSPLCTHCKYDIIARPFTSCIDCHKPSSVGICIEHNKSYQSAWIVGVRTGTLQRLIGNLKFQNMKAAAESSAQLLDARLPTLPANTVLVPIPTAPSHIRERGYDHALLITRYLSYLRNIPIERLLSRKGTETQHYANRKSRIEQALEAFYIEGKVDPSKHYVIVDDVVTTGATIDFASQLLRTAGATSISIAALARQPLD